MVGGGCGVGGGVANGGGEDAIHFSSSSFFSLVLLVLLPAFLLWNSSVAQTGIHLQILLSPPPNARITDVCEFPFTWSFT